MSERPDSNTRVCNLWTPAIAKTPAYRAQSSHLLLLALLVFAQGFQHAQRCERRGRAADPSRFA